MPSHFSAQDFIRPNVRKLEPYRCARDDYSEGILLDANENALGHSIITDKSSSSSSEEFTNLDLHRYPDPHQVQVKSLFAKFRNIPSPDNVFLGVGSDEVIDLIMRISCPPGNPQEPCILTCPPTYGMYKVCAQLNDLGVTSIPLYTTAAGDVQDDQDPKHFQLQVDKIVDYLRSTARPDPNNPSLNVSPIKLILITSPGNPTGVSIPNDALKPILDCPQFNGLLVMDEAYIDFRDTDKYPSAAKLLEAPYNYPNIFVLQTLSKAFGLAGIRLGAGIGHPDIIHYLMAAKAPYSISSPTSVLAAKALSPESIAQYRKNLDTLVKARDQILIPALDDRGKSEDKNSIAYKLNQVGVAKVLGPSHDSNFILVQINDKQTRSKPDSKRAEAIYTELAQNAGVVVRYRGSELGCSGCLRVTVGSPDECNTFLQKLLTVMQEI